MSEDNIWILAITKSKLIAACVDMDSLKVDKSIMRDREDSDFTALIGEIVDEVKTKKFRLLLEDDMADFYGFTLPLQEEGNPSVLIRSELEKELKESIKFDLFGFNQTSRSGEEIKVLSYLPSRELYKLLVESIQEYDLEIESVEPESVSTIKHDNPIIGVALDTAIGANESSEAPEYSIEVDSGTKDVKSGEKFNNLKKRLGVFIKISLTIVLALMLVGGVYYYIQNQSNLTQESNIDDQADLTPTIEVEPTASSEIMTESGLTVLPSLSEYSLSILNGSGVTGEAGYVSGLLTDQGFENISTGNADSQDAQITSVSHKESIPESVIKSIKDTLEEEFEIQISGDMDEESETDIQIVVGERK